MTSTRERQRQRRQHMRQRGTREVTVTVPAEHAERVQRVAATLRAGQAISPRLLPALQALRGVRASLVEQGVARAGIFGSVARGDDHPDSDVDVLLVFPADVVPRMKAVMRAEATAVEAMAARLPGVTADVAIHGMLQPHVQKRADQDILYGF